MTKFVQSLPTRRERYRQNLKYAARIKQYWNDRGYDIKVWVDMDKGIQSDAVNGMPVRKLDKQAQED